LRDEVYNNGTRTRYYTNGTVTFLNFDQSVENTVVAPSYIFSLWKDYAYTAKSSVDADATESDKKFNA